eukprot:CAMPEP_0113588442 /NCGR_PEP_ID=MMETSP0015_2-20120614/35514_1 /TAXON_ID=2838 /ORGANISM="Odontella" /LENGTH=451 /DNA_ID=CAMNT_0000494309 /DNA_START=286 /DNA_END=1641 /DNA_ORIENTATION=- /assembly_acc=CAM_ASM_000160
MPLMAILEKSRGLKSPYHWGGTKLTKYLTVFAALKNVSQLARAADPSHSAAPRLVAFVGNWQPCPTQAQVDRYTDLVVSFAVSYTYSAGWKTCNEDCTIASPVPVCGNVARNDLVDKWNSDGKKVLLSFGGAAMADCWEHCFGREDSVVDQLANIVADQGFDGVDIDYEYHFTPAARKFLGGITSGLRRSLPSEALLTHAPMDFDLWDDSLPYYQILKNNAGSLSYLMVQYYNGPARPSQNLSPALANYGNIAEGIFSGDATKVVFGFCISACSVTGSNIGGAEAAEIMTELRSVHPENGGAFFWVSNDDGPDASWSSAVYPAIFSGSQNPKSTTTTPSLFSTSTILTSSTELPPTTPTQPQNGTEGASTLILTKAKYQKKRERLIVHAETATFLLAETSIFLTCHPPCGGRHEMKYKQAKGRYAANVVTSPEPASVVLSSSDGSSVTWNL